MAAVQKIAISIIPCCSTNPPLPKPLVPPSSKLPSIHKTYRLPINPNQKSAPGTNASNPNPKTVNKPLTVSYLASSPNKNPHVTNPPVLVANPSASIVDEGFAVPIKPPSKTYAQALQSGGISNTGQSNSNIGKDSVEWLELNPKASLDEEYNMWVELVCGLVLYRLLKRFFYDDDALLDLDTSHSNAIFCVADRLEKLYKGSKVYVGLQIPDADSGSRQNIDLVLFTKGEAHVISVKNVSGFVSIDKNGNWVCAGTRSHKTECLPDPVAETKQLVPILEAYLEQRGVILPEGYLSRKVICPNPNFRAIHPDFFPPDVITYDQGTQLKPEQKSILSGWIKGVFHSGKKEMQESMTEMLCSILSTAPMSDRLQLKGTKHVLGEFLEFKGKQDDLQALINIRRSKVSRLIVQKISMFGLAHSTVQVLYSPRDYRNDGASSSEWKEVTVRSSTEVIFQPHNSKKVRKYKLSSLVSMSLSA